MNFKNITKGAGDSGQTSLLFGEAIPKSDPRIGVLAELDCLQVAIGFCRKEETFNEELREIQDCLFQLSGEISINEDERAKFNKAFNPVQPQQLKDLEKSIEKVGGKMDKAGYKLKEFIRYGDDLETNAIYFYSAATTVRKIEHLLNKLTLYKFKPRLLLFSYINRLSKLLWLIGVYLTWKHSQKK